MTTSFAVSCLSGGVPAAGILNPRSVSAVDQFSFAGGQHSGTAAASLTRRQRQIAVADNHLVVHHSKIRATAISSSVTPITTANPGDMSMEKSS